jgi:hypothetical protein
VRFRTARSAARIRDVAVHDVPARDLPSALRRALPLYSNEVILMLHATTVAFTATVPDILKVARDANSATYMAFQSFGLAALIYLAVSFALVAAFRRAERRWLACRADVIDALLGDQLAEITQTSASASAS